MHALFYVNSFAELIVFVTYFIEFRGEPSGVDLDFCEACGGLFFDEDELKKTLPITYLPEKTLLIKTGNKLLELDFIASDRKSVV